MKYQLVEIPGLDPLVETVHRIRALADEAGRSRVAKEIQELTRRRPEDIGKLVATMRLVASAGVRAVLATGRVKVDSQDPQVFEMRGGHIRLFCFLTSDRTVVVCTNTYWKAKPSRQEQDEAFAVSRRLRRLYQESLR